MTKVFVKGTILFLQCNWYVCPAVFSLTEREREREIEVANAGVKQENKTSHTKVWDAVSIRSTCPTGCEVHL